MSTLLILAGGLGRRYKGDKQTSAVGPNGEYIMEYAIYDALNNGFKKIIVLSSTAFIPGLKQKFSYLFNTVSFHFVDQYEHDLNYPNYRKKPWGTAHAVWACRKEIKGHFLVLNADDFYGYETFKIARNIFKEAKAPKFGLITFCLKNTLSHNGGVSRGLCEMDQNRLVSVYLFYQLKYYRHAYLHERNHHGKLEGKILQCLFLLYFGYYVLSY